MNKPKIVYICCSIKYEDDYIRTLKDETLKGHIVLSAGILNYAGNNSNLTKEIQEMLSNLQLAKIDLADEIVIVNKDKYVEESIGKEVSYAISKNKYIRTVFCEHLSQMYIPVGKEVISRCLSCGEIIESKSCD